MIRLIWSQDELLASEAAEDAVAAAPGAEVVSIDADGGIDGIEEALFAASLFATERLVIIRNAQALRKADVERLSEALHREVPVDVLVIATAERSPGPLLDALKDVSKAERMMRPRRGELVAWVNKRMQRTRTKADRDVGPALIDAIGDGLRDLAQAIDQLALRVGGGRAITKADVAEHFRPRSEQPIWVLFDAIVTHDGVKAFDTLHRQLAAGDEPLPMLGAIVSQVRGIMRTKGLLEREPGIVDRDVSKTLGVTEGRAAVMRRQSSRLSWDWLLAVHRLLAQADFELKGGEDGAVLPPQIVMERVVAGALEAN